MVTMSTFDVICTIQNETKKNQKIICTYIDLSESVPGSAS